MAAVCLVCFILKLSKLILTDKIGIPLELTAIVTSFIIQKGTINSFLSKSYKKTVPNMLTTSFGLWNSKSMSTYLFSLGASIMNSHVRSSSIIAAFFTSESFEQIRRKCLYSFNSS